MLKFISTLVTILALSNLNPSAVSLPSSTDHPTVMTKNILNSNSNEQITYMGKDLHAYDAYYSEHYYEYSKLDDLFAISGTTFSSGFVYELDYHNEDNYSLYNLGGKYTILDFDYGHVDRSLIQTATANIYADGELVWTNDIHPDDYYQHASINVTNVKQLKIEVISKNNIKTLSNSLKIGFANVVVK